MTYNENINFHTFSCLTVFLLFSACSQSNSTKNEDFKKIVVTKLPFIIDLKKEIENENKMQLGAIGDHLEYIPLETRPECLLNRIRQIEFTESYISLVMDPNCCNLTESVNSCVRLGLEGEGLVSI